jgi:hypothetical protein
MGQSKSKIGPLPDSVFEFDFPENSDARYGPEFQKLMDELSTRIEEDKASARDPNTPPPPKTPEWK